MGRRIRWIENQSKCARCPTEGDIKQSTAKSTGGILMTVDRTKQDVLKLQAFGLVDRADSSWCRFPPAADSTEATKMPSRVINMRQRSQSRSIFAKADDEAGGRPITNQAHRAGEASMVGTFVDRCEWRQPTLLQRSGTSQADSLA